MHRVGNKYLNTIVFYLCILASFLPRMADGVCTAAFGIDDALIIIAIAAVASATAQTASIMQQKKQDKANARIAESNARAAMRHAENIDLQADQERLQLRLKAQQAVGKQRAKTAASGFVLGQGTSNQQVGDLASAFSLDMKNLNYDIASRVWQQKMKSAEYQNQANAYKASAKSAGKKIGYVWGKAALSIGGAWAGGALAAAAGAGTKGVAFAQTAGALAGEAGTDLFAGSQGYSAGKSANTSTLMQFHAAEGSYKSKDPYKAQVTLFD